MPLRRVPSPGSLPNTPDAKLIVAGLRMSVSSAVVRPIDRRKRRLLFLVTEDWYFWAHRLPLARAARDAGYEVIIATRVGSLGERIGAEGFRLEPLSWKRGSINPIRLVVDLVPIARLYRRVRH